MTVPQVYDVWTKESVEGVSIGTWLGYAVGAGFWVAYGLIHKEKPLFIANFLLLIFDITIVVGVLLR